MTDRIDAAVIFTGRGGSGTRLLSRLAEALGVSIGNRLNRSGDSIEWVDLVYRLAAAAAESLALPTGSAHRRAIRAQAAQILAARPHAAPWGLKLPETMLVLPLLLDAFPRSKVVHLTRHPIASSLRRTHMTSRVDNPIGAVVLPNAYRYCGRDAGAISEDEPYLHNACSWNYQVRRVVDHARAALGPERYLEIRYEDLCAAPADALERARSFLGCPERRSGAIAVDASRMGEWDPRDPRAEAIWNICGETASLLGYARDRA